MARFGRGATLGLVRFTGNKSVPITTCDYSGHVCRMDDTIIQMQYRGNGLVSTGLRVHKRFADKPNPQGKVPPFKVDPKVVTGTTPDVQTFNQGLIKTLVLTEPMENVNIVDWLTPKFKTLNEVTDYLASVGTFVLGETALPEITVVWPEMFIDIIVKNPTLATLKFSSNVGITPDGHLSIAPKSVSAVSFNTTNRWSINYIGSAEFLNG